jgi:hypothetical protein
MTAENPPSFIVRTELQKASFDNGFRIDDGTDAGWLHYRSATAPGEIWLAAAGPLGPWFLSLSLCAVAQELGLAAEENRSPARSVVTFTFATLEELHRASTIHIACPSACRTRPSNSSYQLLPAHHVRPKPSGW